MEISGARGKDGEPANGQPGGRGGQGGSINFIGVSPEEAERLIKSGRIQPGAGGDGGHGGGAGGQGGSVTVYKR